MLFKMSIIVWRHVLHGVYMGRWAGVPQGSCGGQRMPCRKECGSQGLNSGWQPWQQARLPAESSHLLTLVLTKQFSPLFGPLPCSSQMLLLEGRCVFHLPPRGTQGGHAAYRSATKSPGPKVNPSIHLAFWSHLYTLAVSELLGGRSTLRLHTGPGT